MKLLRGWKVRLGVIILVLFFLAAALGPWVEHFFGISADAIDANAFNARPSWGHPLGTTPSGQDLFAQLVVGARGSLLVGFVTGITATLLAAIIGVTGGFVGGVVGHILTTITNLALTLPGLPLILIIASYMHNAGPVTIGILLGLLSWSISARNLRAQTMSLRARDYVTSMQMLGESRFRVIVFEVMPHLYSLMSALFLYGVVAGILAQASLAFLGLAENGSVTWGTMISSAYQQGALLGGMWWWWLPPGLCIALVGCAVGLINFGVDELTNPRLRVPSRRSLKRLRMARAEAVAASEREARVSTAVVGGRTSG